MWCVITHKHTLILLNYLFDTDSSPNNVWKVSEKRESTVMVIAKGWYETKRCTWFWSEGQLYLTSSSQRWVLPQKERYPAKI